MSEPKRRGILDLVEKLGNKLPEPVTLFFIGAVLVLVASELAIRWGWQVTNPVTGQIETAKSLLSSEGMQWVWRNLVTNFARFPPLGVVLVAMIGIGLAERAGLFGALLKMLVLITPRSLLTPAMVFVGINSSLASDAGYLVLPPLAAAVFLRAGRSPLVGMAAVYGGVAAGFSANLVITGLDPLLQSFTQVGAQILDPQYRVDVRCNYYFMVVSTFVMTAVGWAATRYIVEPRFTPADVEAQRAAASQSSADAMGEKLLKSEVWGLASAAAGLLLAGAGIVAMIVIEGAPLAGTIESRPGQSQPVWVEVIVPIMFVMFLVPGLAYGFAAGTIRSDRDIAHMMSDAMRSMGPYIVLAFFAGQFVAWFGESNLGKLLALEGVALLRSANMPPWLLVVSFILLAAILDLAIGSASAKWALMATVFVPIFMGVGISPELTQAAYRVGDSVTNAVSPLNPYMVIVLGFMRRYQPRAGLGSLIALMLPYMLTFLVVWTLLLVAWMALGLPLGPGHSPLFIDALGAG